MDKDDRTRHPPTVKLSTRETLPTFGITDPEKVKSPPIRPTRINSAPDRTQYYC
jgi:hypothetical protein